MNATAEYRDREVDCAGCDAVVRMWRESRYGHGPICVFCGGRERIKGDFIGRQFENDI